MRNIRSGRLTISTEANSYTFPPAASDYENTTATTENIATLRVRTPGFFIRLLLSGDLGFAEAYMFGEVDMEAEDLVQVFLVSQLIYSVAMPNHVRSFGILL